jgi:2-polyprenyl-6-methoxyphenol hydroxylase-like FAD-dependent oxidoreductase
MPDTSDVLVVGGSLGGCAAAILLAQQGLRVTVLEQHRDPGHYKRACTHYMQPGAAAVFERIGLVPQLEAAGAVPNALDLWTRYGWIRPPDEGFHGYSIRRSVLDPMLRTAATATPGVDLRLGVKATQLIREDGRIHGVRGTDHTGDEREFTARVVVGADGRHSPVASWAGVPVKERKHGRFAYFASFEGLSLPRGSRALMWFTDPDVAYVFPNDGGTTVVTVMLTADKLADFRQDVDGNVRRMLAGLPDAPDLSRGRRVSDYVGVPHYPDVSRKAAAPGLALVGDAALTTDYLWGVGCGWALESSAWLADEIGPVLGRSTSSAAEVDRALQRYARRHHHALAAHHFFIADLAGGRRLNPLERLMFAAAVHDEQLASSLARYGGRLITPWRFLSPAKVARSLRVQAGAARATRASSVAIR